MRETIEERTSDAIKGYALNIPYLKINDDDGYQLRDYLEKTKKDVFIKIDLSIARPDNRVEYELWYSSILDLSKNQLVDLGKYQKPFGNHTLFTPRIVTFSCPTCPAAIQNAMCFSKGQYCAFQPKYAYYDDSEDGLLVDSYKDRDERL